MRIKAILLATWVAAMSSNSSAQAAAPVTPFDGAWTVRIQCPSNSEESGAKGYAYEFSASVANGYLSGRRGEEGSAGSLQIEGPISSSGDATLRARGRTGNPDYAVGKLATGTAYTYTIKAHFEASKGSGSRVEARVCNFTFSR